MSSLKEKPVCVAHCDFDFAFLLYLLIIPPSKLHYLKACLIKYLFKGYGNEHITEFQDVSSINI